LLTYLPGTLGEGEVWRSNNSLCRVSSIDAASDASIVDFSIERKVTPPIGSVLQANPTPLVPIGGIGEKAQHLGIGINNTKTFLIITQQENVCALASSLAC